jgi:hypothetical protein
MAMALYTQSNVDNYLLIASTVIVLASGLISVLGRNSDTGEPLERTLTDKDLLDDAICEILHDQSLTVHEILAEIKAVFPELMKGEINSRLYTMLSKKSLQRTLVGKRPTWSLV